MKLVSFNINGLRAHLHQLESIIVNLKPDIIGLQETKIIDNLFPYKHILNYGYFSLFYGKKGHQGVALLSKIKPFFFQYGLNYDDKETQRRVIIAKYSTIKGILTVINGYFPQGDNRKNKIKFLDKKIFYKNIFNYITKETTNSLFLVMGDMNISPTNLDIGIGEDNYKKWIKTEKCSFLPEERKWIKKLFFCGLTDTYRYINPLCKNKYSWFDYRSNAFYKNKGLRIDLLLASNLLLNTIQDAGISYKIRSMQRTSDHAPVWSKFNL